MTVLRVDVGGCSFGLLGLCYITVVWLFWRTKHRDSETNGARGDQAGGGVAWTLKQSLISFFLLLREHILSVTKSLKEDPAEKPK